MASQTATSTQSRKNGRTRAAASKSGSKRFGSHNALTMLRADHDAVLELFDKFESASRTEQKQKLAEQICTELKIHTMIEEEIFYPSLREAQGEQAESSLDEALVEHDGAKKLIETIESGRAGDEMFDAQVKVLSEYIKHHVKEEYREIFPAARKADIDLDEIGAQLAVRKKELKAQQRRH